MRPILQYDNIAILTLECQELACKDETDWDNVWTYTCSVFLISRNNQLTIQYILIDCFFKTVQRCGLLDILWDRIIDVRYVKVKRFSVYFGGYTFIYPNGVVSSAAGIYIVYFTC